MFESGDGMHDRKHCLKPLSPSSVANPHLFMPTLQAEKGDHFVSGLPALGLVECFCCTFSGGVWTVGGWQIAEQLISNVPYSRIAISNIPYSRIADL